MSASSVWTAVAGSRSTTPGFERSSALVGDSADGIPGIPRWGARTAAAALARYEQFENIPDDPDEWEFDARGKATLADNLRTHRDELALYRQLATLREDVPLTESLDDLEWRGARRTELEAICEVLGERELLERVPRWRDD